jgi:hypothetical protein
MHGNGLMPVVMVAFESCVNGSARPQGHRICPRATLRFTHVEAAIVNGDLVQSFNHFKRFECPRRAEAVQIVDDAPLWFRKQPRPKIASLLTPQTLSTWASAFANDTGHAYPGSSAIQS